MFKHFLIIGTIIVIIVVIYLCKKDTFVVIPNQVKYLQNASKFESTPMKINDITDEVFYQDIPWSSSNNNYIHDTVDDRYYIIDKGYYYHISDHNRYKIVITKNVNVNSFKIK